MSLCLFVRAQGHGRDRAGGKRAGSWDGDKGSRSGSGGDGCAIPSSGTGHKAQPRALPVLGIAAGEAGTAGFTL